MDEERTLSIEDFEQIDGVVGGEERSSSIVGETKGEISFRSSALSSVTRRGSSVGEVETGSAETTESDLLLRIMECPICSEFPIPPIYSCLNGHFTCNECISVVTNCSLCEAKFTQVRNHALESIMESTRFKCRYSKEGCQEKINGAEYRNHLEVCSYRPVICNEQTFTQCESKVIQRVNYLDHLCVCHKAKGVDIGDPITPGHLFATFLQSKGDDFSPVYVTLESTGQTFFVFTKKYKSFYCWWVASFEPEASKTTGAKLTWSTRDKFGVTETEDNPVESRLENDCEEPKTELHSYGLQWTLPIHSVNTPFAEIRDGGLCAVLPDTHMQPFRNAKTTSSHEDDKTPEVEWNLTVEILSSSSSNKKRKNNNSYLRKPYCDLESDVDWQLWVEKLRLIFPLLLLTLVIVGVGLLVAIYVQTSSKLPASSGGFEQKKGNDLDSFASQVGKQQYVDMKPYPHLQDNQEEDGDYEGYRGFYHPKDKRMGQDVNEEKGNYGSGGWKNYQKPSKARKGVYRSGAPENDDEFVGYRGFYHQKPSKSNQEQTQMNDKEQPNLEIETNPKNIASKMANKVLKVIADQLFNFLGINSVEGTENSKVSETSLFGFSIDGVDFVAIFIAKLFFVIFCVCFLITLLVSVTMYRRRIYSSPGGSTRGTRSTRSDSNSSREGPTGPEENRQPPRSGGFARRRLI